MEILGTPIQVSLALGIASFSLAANSLGVAVRRGELSMSDAANVILEAQKTVKNAPPLVPEDRA